MFITGTNTDVGKSIITGFIARYFLLNHHSIITQKWIQTGSNEFSPDIQLHWKIMGQSKHDYTKYLKDICPYHFKLPASAHLAAQEENIKINIDIIKKSYLKLKSDFKQVLVEGSGGIMMPIDNKITTLDLIKELNIPVLIVFSNELGAINHTLLTVEQCKKNNIKILGIIANQIQPNQKNDLILKDNPKIIEHHSGIKILGSVPYLSNLETEIDDKPWYLELSNRLDQIYNNTHVEV